VRRTSARYCAKFDFRHNTRKATDGERAALALKGANGERLTCRRTDRITA